LDNKKISITFAAIKISFIMYIKKLIIPLILFLFLSTPERVFSSTGNKPNIVFIYARDFGKGLLSQYGQKNFSTPNIDKLIKEGVSFNNAYSGMMSAPARASLLTGYSDCKKLYSKWRITNGGLFIKEDTSHVHFSEDFVNDLNTPLPANDLYLPQVFQKSGYVTGQIGVLGFGETSSRNQMQTQGWDYYYGYLDHLQSKGFYPPFLFENNNIVMIEGNTRPDAGKTIEPENEKAFKERMNMDGKKVYSADLFLKKSLEFIQLYKDKHFFLMYSSQLPGSPVSIPEIHPEVANKDNLNQVEKEYASMVKLLDEQVGIIISTIKDLGIEKNTVIIFSSDCGHEIYYTQQGVFERPYKNKNTGQLFDNSYFKYYSDTAGDVFNGNMGMAGLKRTNLQGGINVPLVFYCGEGLKSGISDELVANYDLLPTFADMLNVELESKKDGISILPAIEKNRKLKKNRFVVMASFDGPAIIVNDGWKLRYYSKNRKYELYNIKNDPQEKYDLVLRYPEKEKELQQILLKACDDNIDNGASF
jgi:arylsulfatase A-like enzyme